MAYADIYLRPDGVFECLYTDVIDLHELGMLKVERVSTVEFSGELQCWMVAWTERMDCMSKEGVAYFGKRDEALAWEVEQVQFAMHAAYSLSDEMLVEVPLQQVV